MSVLATFYLSNDDDAPNFDAEPGRFLDRVESKGISLVELSLLWTLMRDKPWDADSLNEFPCLLDLDDGERLIHKLPKLMVAGLEALAPDQVGRLAVAWSSTEELSCEPGDIRPLIESLMLLARHAHETNRSLYLWNCV